MIFHPASLLLFWAFLALALQQLALRELACALLPAILFAAFLARARCVFLLRKTRWVLLTMLLLFLWGTPGEYIAWLPLATWEGLQQAAEHVLRLLILLLLLALLLQIMSKERLVEGLHSLLYPLRWFGFDRNRIALRLLLVMRHIENPAPAAGWRHWLEEEDAAPVRIDLQTHAWRWPDYALVAALTGLCGAYLLS